MAVVEHWKMLYLLKGYYKCLLILQQDLVKSGPCGQDVCGPEHFDVRLVDPSFVSLVNSGFSLIFCWVFLTNFCPFRNIFLLS